MKIFNESSFRKSARQAFYRVYDPKEYRLAPELERTVFALKQLEIQHPEFGLKFGPPIPYLTMDSGYALQIPVNDDKWNAPVHVTVSRAGAHTHGLDEEIRAFSTRHPLKTAWVPTLLTFKHYTYRPNRPVRNWPEKFAGALKEYANQRWLAKQFPSATPGG